MTPTRFAQCNHRFGPPPDLEEGQCGTIDAHIGRVNGGPLDGAPMIVTAWKPSEEELIQLNAGAPVFITFIGGGLPPHHLATSFPTASGS